jgi:hypothetical protein
MRASGMAPIDPSSWARSPRACPRISLVTMATTMIVSMANLCARWRGSQTAAPGSEHVVVSDS